jgi:hypothetical protein
MIDNYSIYRPTDNLHAPDPRFQMLVRSNGEDKATVIEFTIRGGKYRVRSAYTLTKGQLEIKRKSDGRVAVPSNPVNTSQSKTLTQGATAPSGTDSADVASITQNDEDGEVQKARLSQPDRNANPGEETNAPSKDILVDSDKNINKSDDSQPLKHVEPSSNGSELFKPTQNADLVFAGEIKKILAGKIDLSRNVRVDATANVLKAIGVSSNDTVIKASLVNKATKDLHEVNLSTFNKLPSLIADPVMVFASATKNNSIVVFLEDTDTDGSPLIVVIHLDKRTGRAVVNKIASIYGKEDLNVFERWIRNGLLKYSNTKKMPVWNTTHRLQLSKVVQSAQANTSILNENDIVNNSSLKPAADATGSQTHFSIDNPIWKELERELNDTDEEVMTEVEKIAKFLTKEEIQNALIKLENNKEITDSEESEYYEIAKYESDITEDSARGVFRAAADRSREKGLLDQEIPDSHTDRASDGAEFSEGYYQREEEIDESEPDDLSDDDLSFDFADEETAPEKEPQSVKERIEKRAAEVQLKNLEEEGVVRVADPQAVADKVKKHTGIDVIADTETGTIKLAPKEPQKTASTESGNIALKHAEPDNYEQQIERVAGEVALVKPIRIRSASGVGMTNEQKKERVREVYRQLKDTPIHNPSGNIDVTITHNGLKHNKNYSADVRKILLLDKLPELIQTAVVARFERTDSRKTSDGNIKGYIKLVVPVRFGLENAIVKITLQKDSNGKTFYDTKVNDLEIQKTPVDVSARQEGKTNQLTAIQQAYKDYTLNTFDVNKIDAALIISPSGAPLTDEILKRAEGEHSLKEFHEIKFAPLSKLIEDLTVERTGSRIRVNLEAQEFVRRVMEEADIREGKKTAGDAAVETSFSGLFTDRQQTGRTLTTLRDIAAGAKSAKTKDFANNLAGKIEAAAREGQGVRRIRHRQHGRIFDQQRLDSLHETRR